MKRISIVDLLLTAALVFEVSIFTVMVFVTAVIAFFLASLSTASITLPLM